MRERRPFEQRVRQSVGVWLGGLASSGRGAAPLWPPKLEAGAQLAQPGERRQDSGLVASWKTLPEASGSLAMRSASPRTP